MVRGIGRVALTIAVVVIVALGTAGQAVAWGGAGVGDGPSRKIVLFDEGVARGERDSLIERSGAFKVKGLPLVHGVTVLADRAAEKALEGLPGVAGIVDDVIVRVEKAKPQPVESLPWGVDRIDADNVWDADHNMVMDTGANGGDGVKVAVLDTGIDLGHPDLVGNIKGGYNAINPSRSANDDNGHGTHVAGIIASADNAIGVLGVAPRAYLYAVKVLDRTGSGYVSDIIEGLQWSMDNGMQVVNMSFGTSVDVPVFHDAIVAAYGAGIVLVGAAGNSGPGDNTVAYPAKYAEVIAVSATDKADVLPYWSGRGPEIELAAPGASILSTYRNGGYKTLSGTSMASPHVAGAAALAIAAGVSDGNGNGRINDELRDRLAATADDLGVAGVDNLYGYGLVDAEEAAALP